MNINDREQLLQTLGAMLRQLSMLQAVMRAESAGTVPPAMSAIRNGLEQLEGMTLPEALSRLVEETAEKLNLSSRVSFAGIDEAGKAAGRILSPITERILYMIARETLYQVEQHQGARKLRLSLNYGRDEVQMSIEDDGASSEAEALAPPFIGDATTYALSINNDLRFRVEQLGGSLEIGSSGEAGTRVAVRVP